MEVTSNDSVTDGNPTHSLVDAGSNSEDMSSNGNSSSSNSTRNLDNKERRRHTVHGQLGRSYVKSLGTRPISINREARNYYNRSPSCTGSVSKSKAGRPFSTSRRKPHNLSNLNKDSDDGNINDDDDDGDDGDEEKTSLISQSLPTKLIPYSFFGLRPPSSAPPATTVQALGTTPPTSFFKFSPTSPTSTATTRTTPSSSPAGTPLPFTKRLPMGVLLEDHRHVHCSTDSLGFPVTSAQDQIQEEHLVMSSTMVTENAIGGDGQAENMYFETTPDNRVSFSASMPENGKDIQAEQKHFEMSADNLLVTDSDIERITQETVFQKEEYIQTSCAIETAVQIEPRESVVLQETFKEQEQKKVTKTPLRRQLSKRKSEVLLNLEGLEEAKERNDSYNSVHDTKEDVTDEDATEVEYLKQFAERTNMFAPSSPKTRKTEDFDPYQIFQVQNAPCLIFKVKVLRGRNITLGFQDYYDTPDPYVYLHMPTSPEGRQYTTVKSDDTNPVWNEEFTFYINFTQSHELEVQLMESNLLWTDQLVGDPIYFNICNITDMDIPQQETFVFNGVCEIDLEFCLEFDKNPTLRYSLCLSDAEKAFQEARKKRVMEGLGSLLGEEEKPRNVNEVPTIAVIGSGGGFRAMTSYSGVFKALVESGILDCVSFAGGLSGSAWFLSTLYSHPKWPDLDMADFLDELMNSVDKKLIRFFNPSTMYQYASYMVNKRRERQPVSFTDIFGCMVGETLLQGRMDVTLTDQREKIKDGRAPMPLYTCVHVKKDVPAKSFQEWVEFSPYEIGLPKYGTFMDSSLFGSKFFMGKLVKQFKEQPLHFLQGIWGSAFCILFKRLLDDNRRIDPAEMIRQEMGDQLDEVQNESSSDCSDDDDDDDEESSSSMDSVDSVQEVGKGSQGNASLDSTASDDAMDFQSAMPVDSNAGQENDSAYEGENDDNDDDDDVGDLPFSNLRKSSIQMMEEKKESQMENDSKSLKGIISSSDDAQAKRKSVNWGKCPTMNRKPDDKRKAFAKSTSMRKSRSGSKGYWKQFMKAVFESKNSMSFLNSRQGRAAVIHNFMRGLSLEQTFPLSPFTPVHDRVQEGDEFDGIFEMHPTSIKHIYMVDAGLTFNSPYPLMLRPQREVDIILSFDFSARPSDNYQPFKELLLAERWARLNRLPFPPIDLTEYEKDGMKELYVFKHPTDPHCPVVLHFPLVNKKFRYYSKPGVPRRNKEEFDFADFDIFDDAEAPYSTFNFTYSHQSFQRLSKLTEFNTLLHVEDIKQVIKDCIVKKRTTPSRYNVSNKDTFLLSMKNVLMLKKKMHKFIRRLGSVRVSDSVTPPFVTPTPDTASGDNPFFAGFKRETSHASSADGSVFGTPGETMDEPDFNGMGHRHSFPSSDIPLNGSYIKPKTSDKVSHPNGAHSNISPRQTASSNKSQAFVFPTVTQKDSNAQSNNTPLPNPSTTDLQSSSHSPTSSSSGISPISNGNKNKKISPPNLFFANLPYLKSSSASSPSTGSPDSTSYRLPKNNWNALKDNSHKSLPSKMGRHPASPFTPDVMRLRRQKVNARRTNNSPMLTTTQNPSPPSRSHVIGSPGATPTLHVQLTKSNCPNVSRLQSQSSSEDNFSLAPEAFQMDGTPVFQRDEAKKYHEQVKEKRKKMFRRQSTISSLNSMSLDEIEEYYYDTNSREENKDNTNNVKVTSAPSIDSGYNSTDVVKHQDTLSSNDSHSSSPQIRIRPNNNRISFHDLSQFKSAEECSVNMDAAKSIRIPASGVEERTNDLHSAEEWFHAQE